MAKPSAPKTWPTGGALLAQERDRQGPRALLAFSTGKDAICAAIALQDSGLWDEIVPFYMAYCPGLSFVEESLDYYERKLFGRRIIRHMHPGFWNQVANFSFQSPAHAAVIRASGIPASVHGYSYQEVYGLVRQQEGVASTAFVASGVRAADSPIRRLHFATNGPVSVKTENWWPIWDLKKADLLAMLDRRGIKLPVDYQWFGRTFDGYDLPFIYPLKRHAPADYRRLLDWFPNLEAEIFRYERAIAKGLRT